MNRAVVWLVPTVVALGASCGGELPRDCNELHDDDGCLVVTQRVEPDSELAYPEGYVSFVALDQGDEEVHVLELKRQEATELRTLSVGLSEGRYSLTSFQKQCGASGCEESGPEWTRRDRCHTPLEIVAAETVEVSVDVKLGDRCTLDVRSRPKE